MRRTRLIIQVLRGPLAALLSVVLVLPPPSALAQSTAAQAPHSKYSESDYAALEKLITTTPPEQMDLEFLKKIYRFNNAKDMLKLIFSRPDLRTTSDHLANVRKNYIWKILAEYARKYYTAIELTNQGKSNGLTSDYDVTGNILAYNAEGKLALRDGVHDVIKYLETRLKDDYLSPDALDITLFNGDVFLPDPRDERLSVAEYLDKSLKGVHELRKQNGAYWAPGGNKEQTHDRALEHGRTVQISHDHASGRDTVNGQPIDLNKDLGKAEELPTRDAARTGKAVRYEGVEDLAPAERWLRSLGDITQNVGEVLSPHDPVAWNKYFIERVIDQGVGRFADLPPAGSISGDPMSPPTYVQMHGADSKLFDDPQKAHEIRKAWKEVFIRRGFGLAENDPRIAKIEKLLDRAAEIQLDKMDKTRQASYAERAKSGSRDYYFREEWDHLAEHPTEAIRKLEEKHKSAGEPVPPEEMRKIREEEACRLFFEAQRELIPEAAVRVAEETFRREAKAGSAFADPEVKRKLNVDRGIELGGLLEIIDRFFPAGQAKESLRQRLIEAVPETSRPEVYGMIELARRKLALQGLDGLGLEKYTKAADGISDRPLFLELAHENVPPADPPIPKDAVKKKFSELVLMSLGPVEADRFRDAWEVGKAAAVAKFGAKAYMKEITEQVDGLMLTGAALGLINAYQQNCILQTSWNEACLTALAGETFNQALFLLPFINSGYMITSGLKEAGEGRKFDGFVNVAMGVLSIPGVANQLGGFGLSAASVLHVYVGFQIPLLAAAVTYGYAVQRMESDGVEQAFKALREPGKNARPFPTANRSAVWTGDTPAIPLLADVIKGKDAKGQDLVPAESLTDAERNRVAMQQSAPAMHAELNEMGYEVGAPEWQAKRRELIVRYGMLLPYLQRMARIHEYFGPKMAAAGENDMMPACMTRLNEDIDKKYGSPPELVDRLRYWWNKDNKEKDRQKDLAAGWSECVERAVKADELLLTPMFNHYLTGWFARQEGDYRRSNEATLRPLLLAALMREYVIHRYIDQGAETERQMKRALNAVKEQSEAKLELLGKLMAKEQALAKQLGQKLAQTKAASPSPGKPKLVLRAPPFAVRVGDPANIDISARGQFDPEDSGFAAGKEWKANLQAEVTKVSLAAPENLIITPQLRLELAPEKGKPKRIVTIQEKLRGQLKDVSGAVVATADANVTYYDLVDWEGAISVEVRAAGPETKDPADRRQTTPYPYAVVKLDGPARATKETAMGSADAPTIASFSPLPEGSFTIHVDPRSTDIFHGPAQAAAALTGISQGTDGSGTPVILMGSGAESVTVVLPYTPRASAARNAPPPKPPANNTAAPGNAPAPAGPAARVPGPPAIDTQLVADCDAFLRRARAALSSGDLSGAKNILSEAGQHKCGDSPSAGPLNSALSDINHAEDNRATQVGQLRDSLRNQMGACQYETAAATAAQLTALAPNDSLADIQAQLERLAALQAAINSLLSAAANPANDAEAVDTLARLREIQSGAPQCLLPRIANAIALLNRRLAAPAARDRIRAAIAACDYLKALAAAMELQTVNPNDEWLKANLGILQAAASEQTNVMTFLRQVKSVAPGPEANDLAGRLRQALGTAPSCLADQIQAGLAELGRGSGQKPAWLDAASQPGSATSADNNLRDARQILQQTTQDEVNRQTALAAQQQQAQQPAQPPQQAAQPAPRPQPAGDPPADPEARRRRRQATFNNLANTLGALVSSGLSGGKIPIPQIPGGGSSNAGGGSAPDPFIGSWMCHMRLTSSRKMPLDGSVQGDYRETISKTANGYYLTDGRSGDSMPSTYVSGNVIRFSARTGSGSMTMDFQVNGNRMDGALRGVDDQDSFVASLQCGR